MSVAGCRTFIYVLSIGPVVGLAARGFLGGEPYPGIRKFYAPLLYIQDHYRMAEEAIGWYESRFVPNVPPSGNDRLTFNKRLSDHEVSRNCRVGLIPVFI
jgi:hypothetical protein